MKIATLREKDGALVFHGNTKDDRIKKALKAMNKNKSIAERMEEAIFDNNVHRYLKAVEKSKGNKIFVSKSFD